MISLSIVCLFGVYNDLYFGTTIKLRYYCLKEKIWKINGKNPEKTLKKFSVSTNLFAEISQKK